MTRHLLAVGPLAWKTLGVFPGEWKECEVREANGEVDALRQLRRRAFDVVVTHPTTTAARDLLFIHDAMQQQPGLRPIVIAPELTHALRAKADVTYSTHGA